MLGLWQWWFVDRVLGWGWVKTYELLWILGNEHPEIPAISMFTRLHQSIRVLTHGPMAHTPINMTDTQYIFIVVIINRFGSCQSMTLHSEHLNTHIHEHVHDIQYEWLSWYTDSIHIPTYNKYYVDSDFIVVQLIVQPCVLQPPAIIYVGYHLSLLVFSIVFHRYGWWSQPEK